MRHPLAILVSLLLAAPAVAQVVTGTGTDLNTGRVRVLLQPGANEVSLVGSQPDPIKIRLAGPAGVQNCLSGNVPPDPVNAPLQQIEVAMICIGSAPDQPGALGGQVSIWIKQRWAAGDGAMRLVWVASTAYTDDGLPKIWALPNLGPFAQAAPPSSTPPPPPVPPSASNLTIVSSVNLTGGIPDISTVGDASWMAAQAICCDTRLTVDVVVANAQTRIVVEARRSGGTNADAPYFYIWIDGTIRYSQQVSGGAQTYSFPVSSGVTHRVEIVGAAHTGTVEVGGIAAQ